MLDTTIADQTQQFPDDFGAGVAAGDAEGAAGLFPADSYWRDRVAFTWNLKTVEGPSQGRDMLLHSRLSQAAPSNFKVQSGESPSEDGGVTTTWITFETAQGRGCGPSRLKSGKILTLLTALQKLKGFEEPKSLARPMGAEHGADRNANTPQEHRNHELATLKPTQLVPATGMSGKRNMPVFPGQDGFKGTIRHSSQHQGGDAWRGRKSVVIGSNNSAHDICAALWQNGADVTMVQRSSTHVFKSDTLMDVGMKGPYSKEAVNADITTEKADMILASLPYRILHEFQIPLYNRMREQDAGFRCGGQSADPRRQGEAGPGPDAGIRGRWRCSGRWHETCRRSAQSGCGRQGGQGLGPRDRHHKGLWPRGRASSAICGNRRSRIICGATVAPCTSRAITRCFLPCN